jgi:hypothetical protein
MFLAECLTQPLLELGRFKKLNRGCSYIAHTVFPDRAIKSVANSVTILKATMNFVLEFVLE